MSKSDPSRVEQPARELERKYWEEFSEQPSRRELFGIVRQLQDELQEELESVQEDLVSEHQELVAKYQEQQAQIDRLEEQVEEAAHLSQTMDEVAEQLQDGKISGEEGAEFLRRFVSIPTATSKMDARAVKLFFKIVEERRVDSPVTTTDLLKWFPELKDSAAPGVQSKRVMQRVKEHREDGFFVGNVEVTKHRGKNCIRIGN